MKTLSVFLLAVVLTGCSTFEKAKELTCSFCEREQHDIEAPKGLNMEIIENGKEALVCLPEEDMSTFLIYVREMEHELDIEVK